MSGTRAALEGVAETLRRDFDAAFALPPAPAAEPETALLAVWANGERYALRLGDLAGLYVDRVVRRVPGGAAEWLGLVGLAGRVVPVYDLAAFVGERATASPRWLAAASGFRLALAFEAFDGHVRVARSAFSGRAASDDGRRHVDEVVRLESGALPVVSVESIVEQVTRRARLSSP